ncbi:hypothetical protein A5790_17825 [Mycobacterium sp. 852002-51152_SCH6134967]|nr:hypothetical protein A5790_17825 [Mycobacterium sp. 852002-51152_SCH6134967]
MARSGTSAVTRVLSLCGATLPSDLVPPDKHNPNGYWESRRVLNTNERILRHHRIAFHDPAPDEIAASAWAVNSVRRYLKSIQPQPLPVIKDPQIITLTKVWEEGATKAGYTPVAVIPIRHPQPVIASIRNVDIRPSAELAAALWLKNTLLAERNTRGMPRVFVDYHNLLKDWRREVKRVAHKLQIDLDANSAVDEFLTSRPANGQMPRLFGTDWINTVYEVLCAAALDEPVDHETLDEVFEAYRVCEHDMRTALADARRITAVQRFFPPTVMDLGRKVAALLHKVRN